MSNPQQPNAANTYKPAPTTTTPTTTSSPIINQPINKPAPGVVYTAPTVNKPAAATPNTTTSPSTSVVVGGVTYPSVSTPPQNFARTPASPPLTSTTSSVQSSSSTTSTPSTTSSNAASSGIISHIDASIDSVLRKNNIVNTYSPIQQNQSTPPTTATVVIQTSLPPGTPPNQISSPISVVYTTPNSTITSPPPALPMNMSTTGQGTTSMIGNTNPGMSTTPSITTTTTTTASSLGLPQNQGGMLINPQSQNTILNTIPPNPSSSVALTPTGKPKKEKEKDRKEREQREREQREREQREREQQQEKERLESGRESDSDVLGKRKLSELLQQISPNEKMDEEVEDIMGVLADDFVESVVSFACTLAKHRNSNTLEVKDLQCHLERNWNIRIPGFGNVEQVKQVKKQHIPENHKLRMQVMKKALMLNTQATAKKSSH
eukprot:gene4028-5039_t